MCSLLLKILLLIIGILSSGKIFQGEYIVPEKIENAYAQSKFVAQAYVHGDSLKSTLVAIIVPDFDVVLPYAMKEFHLEGNSQQLCKNAVRGN